MKETWLHLTVVLRGMPLALAVLGAVLSLPQSGASAAIPAAIGGGSGSIVAKGGGAAFATLPGAKIGGISITSATIAPWRNNATAAYSIVHDDVCDGDEAADRGTWGIFNHWQEASNRGLNVTWAAIGSACAGMEPLLSAMVAAGDEIASHSWFHCDHAGVEPCLVWSENAQAMVPVEEEYPELAAVGGGVDLQKLVEFEMTQSRAWFHANVTGAQVGFYSYPYDAFNDTLHGKLKDLGYIGARGGDRVANGHVNSPDIDHAADPLVDYHVLFDGYSLTDSGATGGSGYGEPSLTNYLDDVVAQVGWGVQELHGIEDASYGTVMLATYIAHLDDLVDRRDSGELWVATPTQVIKYRRSRHHCGAVTIDNGALALGFAGAADASCIAYSTTVTLVAEVSGASAIASRQGSTWLAVRTISAGRFAIDAIPTAGPVTIEVGVSPAITSDDTTTFTVGVAGTFTATATGTPPPAISLAGSLPGGVSFTPATGVLAGTPTAAGSFPVTITAANGVVPDATQSFTLVVDPGVQVIAFGTLGDRNLGEVPFMASAAGGASGNPVVFSSLTTGICTAAGTNGATITMLALGTCTIEANQAGDANYLAADPPVQRSFEVVDTLPPDTMITGNPPPLTNSTSATFTFSGNDGGGSGVASFECSLDGVPFTACTSPKSYTDTELSEGTHSFAVRARDVAGNADPTPATYVWTVDTTPPLLAITSSPAITLANQSAYSIGGTCSENGRAVSAQIGSIAAAGTCGSPASGQFATVAVDVSALPQGAVSLQASMTDAAGNAASATDSTTKDTVAPALTIGTLDAITNANKSAYGFAGTCEAGGGSVGYALASSASVTGSVACAAGAYTVANLDVGALDDGTVSFTVTQEDALGNIGTVFGSVAKDTVNPSVTIDAPPDIVAGNQASYAVSGTCSESGQTVSVSVGPVNTSAVCGEAGPGIYETPGVAVPRAVPDGEVAIAASMTDALGNAASATATATKDTTPTVLIVSDINPSKLGDTITITATLDGYSPDPLPGGTVAFRVGATLIAGCEAQPLHAQFAFALCFVSSLPGGTHAITATYGGDANYFPATSGVLTQWVDLFAQTITFGPLSGMTLGNPPFTVSATASSGLTVTFSSTTPAVCSASGTTVTLLAAGTCTIAADQAGDATWGTAPRVTQSFTVAKATPAATLVSDANPSVLGQPVTFTATLAGIPPPGGTVAFKTGAANIAGCEARPLDPANAFAVCSTSSLAIGTHAITAAYAGDGNYNPVTTAVLNQGVSPLAQTIDFAPLAGRTLGDAPFAVSATASSNLTVTFSSSTPGVCPTGGANGATVTILAAGTCTIVAGQAGDATYGMATPVAQSFAVAKATPTVLLVSDTNPALFGQPVTFTATLTGTPPPGGTVAFRDGSSTIAGCEARPLDALYAYAVCSISSLPVGTRSITAVYGGDANYTAAASAALDQVIDALGLPRLANISTRGSVQTGDNVMIAGFIIGGNAPKRVLITARGPSLSAFGVPGVLADPFLQLFSGQTQIDFNDSWLARAGHEEIPLDLRPQDAREAAILTTLAPGAYTAIVTGSGGTTGIAIVEVFEIDHPEIPLVNISTRSRVETGDAVMIGGFIIYGDTPKTVLVTARGPSLAAFGVPDTLANPLLQLFSGQTQIASNDDWETQDHAQAIRDTGVAPPDSREAAILITLNPGPYTAIVTGAGGTTGVGIVEVFAR